MTEYDLNGIQGWLRFSEQVCHLVARMSTVAFFNNQKKIRERFWKTIMLFEFKFVVCIYIYIYTYTHTHTHTYIYIYIYIYIKTTTLNHKALFKQKTHTIKSHFIKYAWNVLHCIKEISLNPSCCQTMLGKNCSTQSNDARICAVLWVLHGLVYHEYCRRSFVA